MGPRGLRRTTEADRANVEKYALGSFARRNLVWRTKENFQEQPEAQFLRGVRSGLRQPKIFHWETYQSIRYPTWACVVESTPIVSNCLVELATFQINFSQLRSRGVME